jgi:P2-related tail formation protein
MHPETRARDYLLPWLHLAHGVDAWNIAVYVNIPMSMTHHKISELDGHHPRGQMSPWI